MRKPIRESSTSRCPASAARLISPASSSLSAPACNGLTSPYKGGSDAVTAVAAGQADVLFNGMLATWPTVQGGRLRPLGISSAQRVASAAETPTVAEQGLSGFETGSFQGGVGPNGGPHAGAAKLHADFARILNPG